MFFSYSWCSPKDYAALRMYCRASHLEKERYYLDRYWIFVIFIIFISCFIIILVKKRVLLSCTSVSYWLPQGGCFTYPQHSLKGCTTLQTYCKASNMEKEQCIIWVYIEYFLISIHILLSFYLRRVLLSRTSVLYWLPQGGCFSYPRRSPKGCATLLTYERTSNIWKVQCII